MTSSTGCSGLTLRGSPPSRTMPSRIAARSTTAGTPVKSCSSTRAGVNAISFCTFEVTSQPASAWMSSGSTNRASSRRSRFSSRILSENGSRLSDGKPAFSSAGRLKMSKRLAADGQRSPCTERVVRAHPLIILHSGMSCSRSTVTRVTAACARNVADHGRRVPPLGVDGVVHPPHVRDRDPAAERRQRVARPPGCASSVALRATATAS